LKSRKWESKKWESKKWESPESGTFTRLTFKLSNFKAVRRGGKNERVRRIEKDIIKWSYII
jgi:hypothetical protein